MVVALVALLVALSGSAYAALKIGTANIKDNAVTAKKIAPKAMVDSIGFTNVAEGQTRVKDFGSFKIDMSCEDQPAVPPATALATRVRIVADSKIEVTGTWYRQGPTGLQELQGIVPAGDSLTYAVATSLNEEPDRHYSLGNAFVRDAGGETYLVDVVTSAHEDEHRCDLIGKVITGK